MPALAAVQTGALAALKVTVVTQLDALRAGELSVAVSVTLTAADVWPSGSVKAVPAAGDWITVNVL